MSNIVWMTKDGARHPCSNPLEVEAFVKAGWVKYEKPSKEKEVEKANIETDEAVDEMTTLVELAEEQGVKIDKRWGAARIKKALGL